MSQSRKHNARVGKVSTRITRRRFLQASAVAAGGLLAGVPAILRAQGTPSEIVIGCTFSLSGRFQGGYDFSKLQQAWVKRVNSKGGIMLKAYNKSLPIRLVSYDDKSEPPTAGAMYERLATVDKVDLLMGPFSSLLTNACIQSAVSHNIPFFMIEANDDVFFEKENPWRTTGLAPVHTEFDRLVDFYVKKGGVKTFAILDSDTLHDKGTAPGLAANLRKNGFTVVFEGKAPPPTTDFSSLMLAVKEKKPDVIVAESVVPTWAIGVLKETRVQDIPFKDFVVGHAPVPVTKAMGDGAEGMMSMVYAFDGDTPDHQEYLSLCHEAGFEPWQFSESGIRYRAYRRVQDALTRAGTLDKEKVREAMWSTDLPLFGEERMKIDGKGYGTLKPYPVQFQGGKFVSLWPLDHGVSIHKFKNSKW